jgi:undecaprenyl-diphosphatase
LDILEAIVLGIIQGITEFLPISSTGHLTIAGELMGLVSAKNPERWTAFIAVIQLGTLVSTLIYFRSDIGNIIGDFFRDNLFIRKKYSQQSDNSKLGWLIIIGTIPVVIFGHLLQSSIEGALTKNLYVIASSLIILAIILAIAEKTARFKKEMKDITIKDSLVVGVAQCLALIPGSSRSGTTITGGLFMGLTRETAARFSFLMGLPAVFGSGMIELFRSLNYLDETMVVNLIVSTIVSGICGYMAIDFLLKYLKKNTTFLFVYYRIAAGIIILILLYKQIIH